MLTTTSASMTQELGHWGKHIQPGWRPEERREICDTIIIIIIIIIII